MKVLKSLFVLSLGALATGAWAGDNYIQNVPDIVQPPIKPPWAGANWNPNNFCAPTAAANVIQYWNNNGFAGVSGGFAGKGLAGELGWFMDTNDDTVSDDQHLGTFTNDPLASGFDVMNGIVNWAAWSNVNFTFGAGNLPHPTGGAPAGKVAYNWTTTLVNQKASAMSNAMSEIDAGRPLLTAFVHWDLIKTGKTVTLTGGQVIDVYTFNPNPAQQQSGTDEEGNYWDQGFALGHMVTTVGYYQAFQGIQGNDLLIVHDTIPSLAGQQNPGFTTPTDLAIDFSLNVQNQLWKEHVNVMAVPEPFAFFLGAAGLGLAIARRRAGRRSS